MNAIAIRQLEQESEDFWAEVLGLQASFNESWEKQVLLAQILVEQRELNAEFCCSANVALDTTVQVV